MVLNWSKLGWRRRVSYRLASKWRPFRRLNLVRGGWKVGAFWWAAPHRTLFVSVALDDWRWPGRADSVFVVAFVVGPVVVGRCDISKPGVRS